MSQLNSISSLTKLNFSLLSLEQKIAIKNEGRPKRNLIIVKESKGKVEHLREILISKRLTKTIGYVDVT